ncbi:phosphopentomutase [Thermosporothrix hazakensis]|uniref:Phosphopentomutase n=2 Tax=Thermosporothrix TaxID=768650 RepID=A0A326TZN3_THEHA|nr:phosphopentomutase [Thermosporothrix hazakensis]PZW22952.1 phosphopentomutase [Thermosporothrix hazakensis]GCE48265.1 phosphopentomutase [Thermosporothrix hazakensis]
MNMISKKRAVLCILDGLGIGAMPDAPEQQQGANTTNHVISREQRASFPHLAALGLFEAADGTFGPAVGRAALGYPGADSYLGHNELLGGTAPETHPDTVRGRLEFLIPALEQAGFIVHPIADNGALWVNNGILVSDNLENEPGMAINLAATFDIVDLETLVRAGEVVRTQVRNPRVIAFGSPEISPESILSAVHKASEGRTGIVTPEVGFYKEGYLVRHLGVGFKPDDELPLQFMQAGYPVELIGKVADVAAGDQGIPRRPTVDTPGVLSDINETWERLESGLIVATVQETDLSGHAEDVDRFRDILRQVDTWLGEFLPRLDDESLLIISADHGNDPTYGTHHTREYVPVLVRGPLTEPLTPMSSLRGVAALCRSFFGLA